MIFIVGTCLFVFGVILYWIASSKKGSKKKPSVIKDESTKKESKVETVSKKTASTESTNWSGLNKLAMAIVIIASVFLIGKTVYDFWFDSPSATSSTASRQDYVSNPPKYDRVETYEFSDNEMSEYQNIQPLVRDYEFKVTGGVLEGFDGYNNPIVLKGDHMKLKGNQYYRLKLKPMAFADNKDSGKERTIFLTIFYPPM